MEATDEERDRLRDALEELLRAFCSVPSDLLDHDDPRFAEWFVRTGPARDDARSALSPESNPEGQ